MDPALEILLKKERGLWRGRDQYYARDTIATGHKALDNSLPSGGWNLGTLTELLIAHDGIGEFSLLLPALRKITTSKQWAALINPPYVPYAPALATAGLNLEHLLVIDSKDDTDTLWSAEQLLRSGTFQVVIFWIHKARNADKSNKLRRLQLAAEQAGAWAVAYRNIEDAKQHSSAALRICLQAVCFPDSPSDPTENGLQLDLIKVRGGNTGRLVIAASEFDAFQGIEWPGTQSLAKSVL